MVGCRVMTAAPAEKATPRTRSQYGALVELPYRRKLLLVVALTVTLFVTTMNQSVVSTSAQNIVADLGAFELFTWLFAGFSLAGAVSVPIIGKLSDLVGRKPVMVWSLVIFLAASAWAGLAQDMTQLIAARIAQGVGFSGVLGSVWIMMAALWAPNERAKWLGVTSAGFTLSGLLGPVIGGVVSDALSWRWTFFMNLPSGGAALVLLLVSFPPLAKPVRKPKFDLAGAGAFAVFASLGLFAISAGGETIAWGSPVLVALLLLSGAAFITFLAVERRVSDPVVPLDLFRSRVFSGAMAASMTITTTFAVVSVFMPLYIQGARGQAATASAVPLMANAAGVALGSNLGGQIVARRGYVRELAVAGLSLASAMIFYFGTLTPDTSMALILVASVLLGVGVSLGFTSFTAPVQNAMPEASLGVVTTSLQFARVLGMAVATAALGALLLAQLTIGGASSGDPRLELADPEVLVSAERLEDVRQKFVDDPQLGLAAYKTALAESRADLASAVRVVFRVAGVVSATGVVLSFVTFAGMKGRRRERPAAKR